MTGIRLEDAATRSLIQALDGLSTRQSVISNNLANVDTPGFKASDVSFARQLDSALAGSGLVAGGLTDSGSLQLTSTNDRHLPLAGQQGSVEITSRPDTSQRADGNNVDIEKEMENLAETSLHYQAATRMLSRRLSTLRTVIREGR